MKMQKIGGISSLVNAFLMVFFIVVGGFVLKLQPSDFYDSMTGFDKMRAMPNVFYILYLGGILSSIAYFPMVLALKEKMQDSSPNLMLLALIGVSIICALMFAAAFIGILGMPLIVSSKDASAFRAIGTIYSSLGIASEFSMGWVLLLIGWAALKIKRLPRILSYLFVLKGVVMILEIAVASLSGVGILLGLIFYTWLGIYLLRNKD